MEWLRVGEATAAVLSRNGLTYEPLVVFTNELLPSCNDGKAPDLEWLARREQELGISIQRMLAAERHLLAGRTFAEIMRMAEVALREIASAYDRARPDFAFSEDISCFHSYVHFALARERKFHFGVSAAAGYRIDQRVRLGTATFRAFRASFQRDSSARPEHRRASHRAGIPLRFSRPARTAAGNGDAGTQAGHWPLRLGQTARCHGTFRRRS